MREVIVVVLGVFLMLGVSATVYSGGCQDKGVESVDVSYGTPKMEKCSGAPCADIVPKWIPVTLTVKCQGADGNTSTYCVTDYNRMDAHHRFVDKTGYETYTNSKYRDTYYHGSGCCWIPFVDCWDVSLDHYNEYDLYQERPCN